MTQDEIEKAAKEWIIKRGGPFINERRTVFAPDTNIVPKPELIAAFLAGAEHAKQEERFRIVQILTNLPEVSIENITWGEIARLIEAPEAESK